MAIYLNPEGRVRTRCDELGVDILIVQGPPLDTAGWTTVLLYFWACQPDFVDNSGVGTGGGHFGLQAYDNGALTRKTVINWGCYDDTIGGGATFRSSKPLDSRFIDYGNQSSYGFPWQYQHWYRFRIFRSPKQNYVAAEINPGALQIAPYVGTDQQAAEVAFRCTVQDLTIGDPPIFFQDVLVKNAATSRPIQNGTIWTEPIDNGGGGVSNQVWPYDPICRVRHPVFDGARVDTKYKVTYFATATHCDGIVSSLGANDYMQMYGTSTLTRSNPQDTILTVPSTLWDAAPANVTPNPSADGSARVATPRPWY